MLKKTTMITAEQALAGRDNEIEISEQHTVLKTRLKPPFNNNLSIITLGLGCFWGAERLFWKLKGVYTTAVGYAGGYTKNPAYEEVCTGNTGHTEVVLVVYDPGIISLEQILSVFWQSHDPTQGMRQGNDIGTQYRSAIFLSNKQDLHVAETTKQTYQKQLQDSGFPAITTEIREETTFYYAEDYHQQYLDKNPNGYCGLSGTGISFQ